MSTPVLRQTRRVSPMLVYDGDCAFCTRCADWLRARAPDVDVAPWQGLDLADVGLTEDQVRAAAYWVDGGVVVGGEGAVARALLASGRGYPVLGRVLLLPGVRRLAGLGYRFVAGHRGAISSVLLRPPSWWRGSLGRRVTGRCRRRSVRVRARACADPDQQETRSRSTTDTSESGVE